MKYVIPFIQSVYVVVGIVVAVGGASTLFYSVVENVAEHFIINFIKLIHRIYTPVFELWCRIYVDHILIRWQTCNLKLLHVHVYMQLGSEV